MNGKKKKKVLLKIALLLSGIQIAVTGCGQNQTVQRNVIAPLTDYVSAEEMESAKMGQDENNRAVAAVMRKAAAGEEITIAYIGGSITQGTISDGSSDAEAGFRKSYVEIGKQWWDETFPDTKVNTINAGIGATDSYLGVHRVERDVLAYKPDLVVVEFSVNDDGGPKSKVSYDNLVRRILLAENHPAVILLFMGQTNGANAQSTHALVGFTYGVPMLSYCNVMKDMQENKIYTDKQLSGDVTHPSALGHAVTGEILWKYFNEVYAVMDDLPAPEVFDKAAFTNEKYLQASMQDATDVKIGEPFTVTCSSLGIVYEKLTNGNGTRVEVYVDGEYVSTLDADFKGGWGNYAAAQEVFTADETAEHTVELIMEEGSEGKTFSVHSLLVSCLDERNIFN